MQYIKEEDVIIILGNPATEDGSPSKLLKQRLDLAIRVKNNYDYLKLILTGNSVYNKHIEAEVMKRYLIDHNILDCDLIIENKATNTYENARLSKYVCEINNFKNPIIVTNHFHRLRSKLIFKKHFQNFIILCPKVSLNEFLRTIHIYIWEFYLVIKILFKIDKRF